MVAAAVVREVVQEVVEAAAVVAEVAAAVIEFDTGLRSQDIKGSANRFSPFYFQQNSTSLPKRLSLTEYSNYEQNDWTNRVDLSAHHEHVGVFES